MTSTQSGSPRFPAAAQGVVAMLAASLLLALAGWFVAGGGLAGGLVTPTPPGSTAPLFIVDVNTAPPRELAQLPGLGPALAARIVAHRDRHGPFTTPEDLLAVPGIGAVTLARIRPYLEPRSSAAAAAHTVGPEGTP